MSMLELWMIKTGRIQQSIKEDSEGYAPLYWGERLEPLVAEYYSMHTNYKVRRVNAVLQHPDPDKSFMLANLDYSVVGDADASGSAAKALQQLYPEHLPLSTADLSLDDQANRQFEQLLEARNQIDKHQEQFDLLKHQLQAKMQQAERAIFKTGSVTWKKAEDSISLDSKALLQHYPEFLQQFPQNRQGSRRFQIYTDAI